jgi:hypothetical protein
MGAEVIVPAALGAAGLWMQNDANQSAKDASKKAQKGQDALLSRQTGLFDALSKIVQMADAAGEFDATAKNQKLLADTSAMSKKDMGNQAGAFATMGYKPGDTPPIDMLSATAAKYQKYYSDQAQANRDQALWNKISAYRSIDPTALNTGIGVYGQREATAAGQQTSLAPTVMALSPYIQGMFPKKTGVNTGATTGSSNMTLREMAPTQQWSPWGYSGAQPKVWWDV